MTRADIEGFDAPKHGTLFCSKGIKSPRNSVSTIDPIVRDDASNSYDPGNGFGTVFTKCHSELSGMESPDGIPLKTYNNYATVSDFNLLFYLASIGTILPTIGYPFEWKRSISEKNSGYPWGAIVRDSNGVRYISVKNDNTDPIGEDSTSWIRYRNSNWFNFSNHKQPSNTDRASVTEKAITSFLPLYGGGLVSEKSNMTPVVIYRLHSIKEKQPPYTVYTWPQAYKYWIGKENSSNFLWSMIDGNLVKVANVASIERFDSRSGSGVQSGPLKNIKQYYGSKGAYVITWRTDEDGYNYNPFSRVYDPDGQISTTYDINLKVSGKELALDTAMYGYGEAHLFVKPEFDDEEGKLEYTLEPNDLEALKGLFRVGGEAIHQTDSTVPPSEETMGMGAFLDTISLYFAVSEMGNDEMQNAATSTNSVSLSEGLPGSIIPELPVSFDNGRQPDMYVENGALHNKLSSDPTIIRRGIEVNLVFRSKAQEKDVPIQTLYRNMWSEIVCRTVSNKAEGSGLPYSSYVSTVLPDTVDRISSEWQLAGANNLYAYLPGVYKGEGRLVIVAKYKNIQVSRHFRKDSATDFYDETYGMYYQGDGLDDRGPRTFISARSIPYERIPNALSKASFNVPPESW